MKVGVVFSDSHSLNQDLLDIMRASDDVRIFHRRMWQSPLMASRINRNLLQHDLSEFTSSNQVVFFDWAGELLVAASHLPKRCPIVARLHSYELFDWAPFIDWNYVDRIVLVCQAMRDKFVALYPAQADKTRVIYFGKDLSRFGPAQRDFDGNLGMLGNLIPIKRIYEMILTLHELRQEGFPLRLHLGGEPQKGADSERYLASMQSAVEKLGLKDYVHFYGRVADPAAWLQKIDCFISNSYWESTHLALVEAMATGCYSLAHFWDGAEEVLPRDYLFATESELKEKIISFLHAPNSVKREHQERMRKIACERLDLNRFQHQILQVIDETARDLRAG